MAAGAGAGPLAGLSLRQRASFAAHLFKAVARQHHRSLLPLLRSHVGATAVVIDAGAHAGQFTKLFAALAPRGHVYAFEPASYARAILTRVLRLRRIGNVTVVAAALSDRPGATALSTPLKTRGSLGFGLATLGSSDGPALRETVAVMTVDGFMAEQGLAQLDFLKADIEGWEVPMLRGAAKTIAAFRPVLLLELVAAHLTRGGSRPDDAWSLLAPLGYTAFRVAGDGALAEVASYDGDADYLFVPE